MKHECFAKEAEEKEATTMCSNFSKVAVDGISATSYL